MQRVFITGAAGFIGRVLADRLRAGGVEVRGVDRVADPAAGIVAGDISEPGEWQNAAAGAGRPRPHRGPRRDADRRVGLLGRQRPRYAAGDRSRAGGGVGRVVHLSSVVTFGLDFPDQVGESHPVRPTGVAYTDTKIAAEQVALMAHAAGEQEVVVVRPGDVYGPGSRPWTLMPLEFIRRRRLALPARGRGIHSPVFVDDLVAGIVRAATAPEAAGRVITLSGGVGVETRDYFGRLGRMAGMKVPAVPTSVALAGAAGLDRVARLRGVPNELTPDGVRYLAERRGTYGIRTARELLGWSPEVDLDEGMARTEGWLRDEGLI